eukprot:GEZU01032594.1.p1 GENE.GEZU01032594.1~~GEZU01032594.1.p1  ORF type:complete len:199 (-),score=62.98 GEZU01032594.1:359-955(-)
MVSLLLVDNNNNDQHQTTPILNHHIQSLSMMVPTPAAAVLAVDPPCKRRRLNKAQQAARSFCYNNSLMVEFELDHHKTQQRLHEVPTAMHIDTEFNSSRSAPASPRSSPLHLSPTATTTASFNDHHHHHNKKLDKAEDTFLQSLNGNTDSVDLRKLALMRRHMAAAPTPSSTSASVFVFGAPRSNNNANVGNRSFFSR